MTASSAPDKLDVYVQLSFRTNAKQADAISSWALRHQRSLSGEIRRAIDEWLERCAKEDGAQPTEGR